LVIIDYDAGMVEAARKAVSCFAERATVQQADAAKLPFSDDSFDVVSSFAMLHHVGDWPRAINEALRVLRPGGRLIGYHPLDGPLTRLLHCGEGNAVRLIRGGQLEAELARMPATEVRTSTSFGGLAVRFTATRLAESDSAASTATDRALAAIVRDTDLATAAAFGMAPVYLT
jgi:SAM-dependent methyltransferase